MKLGCIGYGNMASAILGGLIAQGDFPPENIFVYDPVAEKLEAAKQRGMHAVASIEEAAEQSDVILLAVKPISFTEILGKLVPFNIRNRVFISIAAGITLEKMELALGKDCPIVRAMPNTPLLLGQGTTALCHNDAVKPEAFAFARNIFAFSGTVYNIPEKDFNAVINLNGSSPAYIYLFAKIIAEYTSRTSGISSDIALAMICDTLKGSADMMLASGHSPDELIQMVSSPNGTTVAALKAFSDSGFTAAIEAGLQACVNRAIEMGNE